MQQNDEGIICGVEAGAGQGGPTDEGAAGGDDPVRPILPQVGHNGAGGGVGRQAECQT